MGQAWKSPIKPRVGLRNLKGYWKRFDVVLIRKPHVQSRYYRVRLMTGGNWC